MTLWLIERASDNFLPRWGRCRTDLPFRFCWRPSNVQGRSETVDKPVLLRCFFQARCRRTNS